MNAYKIIPKTKGKALKSSDFRTVFSQEKEKAGQMTCFFSGCGDGI
jgi:hypothetical protein